jgi:hypothetical protein
MDDSHFSYIFPWMIATLATNKNSQEKNSETEPKNVYDPTAVIWEDLTGRILE